MNKKVPIFIILSLLLVNSGHVHAQFNRSRILLFDRAPSVILDSSGEFRIDRFNQSILELEVDYHLITLSGLNRDNLVARVRKMTFTHVYNMRSGEVERSSVVLLDSATELSINMEGWETLLLQSILSDDEVYNTIFGRVQDGDKKVWKIIKQRARAQ